MIPVHEKPSIPAELIFRQRPDCRRRVKGLVDRDVVLFNPNEYLFFGLLGMLEHASGDKSLQKALTNAIAVLPSGGRALENAGFVPDPDYL